MPVTNRFMNRMQHPTIEDHVAKKQTSHTNGDKQLRREHRMDPRDQFLLVLSAHDERTLASNIAAIQDVVEGYRLIDLAHTLAVRRSTLSEKCFLIAKCGHVKQAFALGDRISSRTHRMKLLNIAFVFTGKYSQFPYSAEETEPKREGQGAQWPRMGADLMESFPTYLATIRRLDAILHGLQSPPIWTLEGDNHILVLWSFRVDKIAYYRCVSRYLQCRAEESRIFPASYDSSSNRFGHAVIFLEHQA